MALSRLDGADLDAVRRMLQGNAWRLFEKHLKSKIEQRSRVVLGGACTHDQYLTDTGAITALTQLLKDVYAAADMKHGL
jgi:hypothetical protein